MDTHIWQLTIALEFAILAGLWWKRCWVSLPIFTATIIFCSVESFPLAAILHHGTKLDYYYAYYAANLFNLALYTLSAVQCWKYPRWRAISCMMVIYVLAVLPTYALIATGHRSTASAYLGDLRYVNLACYFVWTWMVWRYDDCGTKSHLR